MKEIADFLEGYPPFTDLSREELEQLSTAIDVKYHLAGDLVVEVGQPSLGVALMVRAGRLEVLGPVGTVVDEVDPGDLLSLDTVRAGRQYAHAAKAAEDTLLYLVPLPDALRVGHLAPISSTNQLTRPERLFDAAQGRVTGSMRPVIVHPASTSIADVAKAMTKARTSCSLVTSPDDGLGIVTDSELRRRVATGAVPITASVGSIAAFPAQTVSSEALLGDAYLSMVEAGIHHLVIVDAHDRPVGVVRVVDVASAELRDPLVVRGAVERAQDADELVEASALVAPSIIELVERGLPVEYIAQLQSGVVDAILRRAVALVRAPEATKASTWLVQGSLARREPLPGSDVDTALCWYDGDPGDHLAHASRVLRLVERAGLATCDRGANADNSLFNRSEDQWRQAVADWLGREEEAGVLALTSVVADTRPVSGELVSPLVEAVSAAVAHEAFMGVLTRHTLSRRTPLGFVRDFVVHQSGEHRGQLDLKKGGLLPVSALARWLALRTGDVSGSTLERLDRGADAGLITGDERDMLVGAYKVALTVLAEHQVRAIKAGNKPSGFLRPDQLDPLERRQLREAFRAIDSVQSALAAALGLSRL
ncbi:MAG: DUF294 nucleotidyltransferase-like domain-containing protein [Micrococcales bacterium]|nr:DUF294 nucleotidyltransferase-like domain-containing protein [Micrococcales bacterium]